MTAQLFFSRVLVAMLALFATASGFARGGITLFHPTGTWEIKVGGQLEGERVNGIAYVGFDAGGGVSGYFMSRLSGEVLDVSGTWASSGTKFIGSIQVTDDVGIVAALSMAGSAREGRSMSAKLTDAYGSAVSLKGKPLVAMTNLSGTYYGSLRQYGAVGSLSVSLIADGNGAYEVEGLLVFGGYTYELAGYALVNRSGNFVAYMYNYDTGAYSSLWGKIKGGTTFTGSGVSLYDGSSMRVSLTR